MQQQQQQQHSFSLMLATPLKDFTGRLSCTYDRPFRLCGCWEAALISFTHTRKPAYILCDLLEYTEVNNHKVQLLDYFYSEWGIKTNGRTQYVKVSNKRFSTINIDIKWRLNEDIELANLKNKLFEHEDPNNEIACLIHFRRIG
jgi:hypothetical protein